MDASLACGNIYVRYGKKGIEILLRGQTAERTPEIGNIDGYDYRRHHSDHAGSHVYPGVTKDEHL